MLIRNSLPTKHPERHILRYWPELYTLVVGLIVVTAAVLRIQDLTGRSLWFDEIVSWQQSRLPFGEMIQATAQDNYPPLHNLILYAVINVFGDSETALRAPSALLGIATVILIYKLGTTLWDRRTGLIAALLLTFSGFHIAYSMEARMYSLLVFAATFMALATLNFLRRGTPPSFAAYVVAATILLFSHVYGSIVFIGVNAFVGFGLMRQSTWLRIPWQGWLLAQGVAVTLFLPWAIVLGNRFLQDAQLQFLMPEPRWSTIEQLQVIGTDRILLLTATFLVAALLINRLKGTSAVCTSALLDWQAGFLLTWFVTSVLGSYIFSVTNTASHPRHLICALPALILLASRVISLLASTASSPLLVVLIPLFGFDTLPTISREDHRGSMREFALRYRPGDQVMFLGVGRWGSKYAIAPSVGSSYYYREKIDNVREYTCWGNSKLSMRDMYAERVWVISQWNGNRCLRTLRSGSARYSVQYKFPSRSPRMYLLVRQMERGNRSSGSN